jgi:hypothetical protein
MTLHAMPRQAAIQTHQLDENNVRPNLRNVRAVNAIENGR